MKKFFDWFKESNRYKHFIGGILLGYFSCNLYCAIFVGLTVGGALEFKDKEYGGNWDNIDLILTVLGSLLGFGIRTSFLYLVFNQ